jgi:Ni2+-binding GTPase involved in maturation of urease and hydrogenase
LSNDKISVVLLIGAGGAGKTRVLKQAVETYEAEHKGSVVRFLNPADEVTADFRDKLSLFISRYSPAARLSEAGGSSASAVSI